MCFLGDVLLKLTRLPLISQNPGTRLMRFSDFHLPYTNKLDEFVPPNSELVQAIRYLSLRVHRSTFDCGNSRLNFFNSQTNQSRNGNGSNSPLRRDHHTHTCVGFCLCVKKKKLSQSSPHQLHSIDLAGRLKLRAKVCPSLSGVWWSNEMVV